MNCRAVTGDAGWSNYTLSVRARKLGGLEGFLIMFNVKDDNNWTWWNIGGWGNTQNAIENCVAGANRPLANRFPATSRPASGMTCASSSTGGKSAAISTTP